jgi:hypothetical protein
MGRGPKRQTERKVDGMAERNVTLTPLDSRDEIPAAQRGQSISKQVVEEFLQSGAPAAKLDGQSKSFWLSLGKYIKAHNAGEVEVVTRKGGTEVYLALPGEMQTTEMFEGESAE